ncbi:hypothetical protein TPAU25S_00737 [Tsukamurella paurometabola]|uniref:DUF3558 domain-containing protein n=1 Tax=Tsukamurella paurometabola (strain ATCC 8368 / DSM 20162 / CCUG 35730 / CIP 100753 / JCM 10117 / KCTC 9821 / NBRC 16120 / NCIMB 702349 / NCTC 13040) TaxID=521096 RepID=D5UU18_TSUPD|nr:DUF3558 domain-containing protein [Tsukamurella paurometabola]ADG79521.1 hypothetical protein Tpau_2923 [Tsukamurella paurometabola DSM 20162]SUP36072.1 Protein of uncharacterised function (DUF3558) [Tsukamurella paurometabola]
MTRRHRGLLATTAATGLVILGTAGCATAISGEPTSALWSPRTSPKPLPFTPTIKNRTNDRTNGTTFEPCSAYTDTELRTLGIDPATISDAAQVDSANYRGCHWQSIGYSTATGKGILYSQITGDEKSLDTYKRKYRMLPWQTDRIVNRRSIAVATENDYCLAVFASEAAVVITRAGQPVNPSPGRTVECEKAIAFASLAITKAPE